VRSPHGGLSEAVERQLISTLFNQRSVLVAGNAPLIIVAVVGWLESAQGWFLTWAIAIAVTLAARLAIELVFDRRSANPAALPFGVESTPLVAGQRVPFWDARHSSSSSNVHPVTPMLVLSTELVFIMGSVARVCACPVIAKGQALLGLVPIFVVCVLPDDVY
jgi:hypothetical protein